MRLNKQNAGIAEMVDNAVDHAQTFDEAEHLANFAQQLNLTTSYQHALRREVAVASDPLLRIEIQYSLVQSLVASDNAVSAE